MDQPNQNQNPNQNQPNQNQNPNQNQPNQNQPNQNQNPNQNQPNQNQNPNQNQPNNDGNNQQQPNQNQPNQNQPNQNQNPNQNQPNNDGNNQQQPNQNGPQQTQPQASSSSVLLIPQTAAAGGITMTQPPQTATSYYKIAPSQVITFGWNMTSVLATPTRLTVSAICDNGNTYPVGPTDGIIPGTATQVEWDIYSYQMNNPNMPLAQGTYTLNIWDDRGPGAMRRGGYLSPFNALQFALYTPQPYTGLADGWSCSHCNGSVLSAAAHPAFVGIVVSFLVIFLSGFHMLRTSARA